jgi:hypothetical protein
LDNLLQDLWNLNDLFNFFYDLDQLFNDSFIRNGNFDWDGDWLFNFDKFFNLNDLRNDSVYVNLLWYLDSNFDNFFIDLLNGVDSFDNFFDWDDLFNDFFNNSFNFVI